MLAAAAVYAILFFVADGLRFPIRLDETHFWPTSLLFSHTAFPSLGLLRSYEELNTPLPFVLFGNIERLFHAGIFGGRLFNLLLSLGIVCVILWEGRRHAPAYLAAVGLMLFPYFFGVSVHLYTDMVATFAVVMGLWLYDRERHLLAAAAFALAIASRQYMVAFPLAIALWEAIDRSKSWRTHPSRWIAPAVAAASLGAWFWLFGGPAPAIALANQGIPPDRVTDLAPSHLVFLLSCVGLFYVGVETLLYRRWCGRVPGRWQICAIIAAMMLAAAAFPPLGSTRYGSSYEYLGVMDHNLARVFSSAARVALYGAFASLAAIRFRLRSLEGMLIWTNGVVLTSSHIMWEKYALALLAVIWYLRARDTVATSIGATESAARVTAPNASPRSYPPDHTRANATRPASGNFAQVESPPFR